MAAAPHRCVIKPCRLWGGRGWYWTARCGHPDCHRVNGGTDWREIADWAIAHATAHVSPERNSG